MIKIWDTDILFRDSPDVGEDKCICTRCRRKIKENETVARIFMNSDDLVVSHKETKKVFSLKNDRSLEGLSFELRFCYECNINWLKEITHNADELCHKAIELFPNSLYDQYNFIIAYEKHNN